MFHPQAATTGPLEAEKRTGAQKIQKNFTSEETSSAEVMEREEVEEEAQMYHEVEEDIMGQSIKSLPQKGFLSMMEEPDEVSEISSDVSVTDGLKTQGLKTERKKAVAVQDECTKQKSQDKKFSVQKTDSLTVSVEIKDIKKDTKELKEVASSVIPEISVKVVSDQTFEAEAKKTESIITQGLKDKSKLSVRKPEVNSTTDSKLLEKTNLQKKIKQTDHEPFMAENIEMTSKMHETDSSELFKPIEKVSSKPRIVEYKEAEEKLNVTPKSARRTAFAEKPIRLEIDSQSSQVKDSQSKESELLETEEKRFENVSHKNENKTEEIQSAVSKGIPKKEIQKRKVDSMKKKTLDKKPEIRGKDATDKELLEEDTPEKCIRTDEHGREAIRLTDKLQKTFDDFQLRAVTEKDQDMKKQGRKDGKASVKPAMELMLTKEKPSSEKLPESILSKVVTLKDKLVKVSPMEGTTEMKPNRETSVTPAIEVRHPESLSDRETISDNTLQKPEMLSKGRILKDVPPKVRRQTLVEDEEQFKAAMVKDKHTQVSPKETTKPRPEQTQRKPPVTYVEEIKAEELLITEYVSKNPPAKEIASNKEEISELQLTVEEIRSTLVPVKSKTGKVATTEKKTLKRQEQIDSTVSEASEPEVTYAKSLAEYDAPEKYTVTERSVKDREIGKGDISQFETVHPEREILLTKRKEKSTGTVEEIQSIEHTKKDKRAKFARLEEKKMRQEQTVTEAEGIPEMEVKEKKPDDNSQKKDVAEKLVKTHKITDKAIKDETGKVSATVKTKPIRPEQTVRKDSFAALQDKPSKERTAEEVQSKTVTVKDEYSSVVPFEATDTKQEQGKIKFSVAPVMEVASERSLIVKDGDVTSDAIQRYITPDELVKDITSRKENVYKLDDICLRDQKDIRVEQVKSKVGLVQDKTEKVTPIREKLPERQEEIEKNVSVASKPGVTDKQSLVQQEVAEKHTVMDKTTTVLQAEEINTGQKQTGVKIAVTPVTEITDTEIKDIQSKKSKSLKEKGQRLDKGIKMSLEEVQPKTVTVQDEFGCVTPFDVTETKPEQVERTVSFAPVMEVASEKHLIIKDGGVKSGTLQRFIIPDKLVEDVASRKEDIYESDEERKEIKTETMLGKDKEFHEKEKTEIKAVEQEQINSEQLVIPMKRSEEMYQSKDVVDEEVKISEKYKPAATELKADADLMPWHEPTVREPSVTDKTKPKMTGKKTTDYKTDSPEYREGATRKWDSEVEQSCLKADVQYVPPPEVKTISRKKEELQRLQSIIETRILSLEPEGKEHVSLQESSRGIEGKMLHVTAHVFLI